MRYAAPDMILQKLLFFLILEVPPPSSSPYVWREKAVVSSTARRCHHRHPSPLEVAREAHATQPSALRQLLESLSLSRHCGGEVARLPPPASESRKSPQHLLQ